MELPAELADLTEDIVHNVHETWAENLIKQGWTYGEEKKDAEKKHPCLIESSELSEDDKDFENGIRLWEHSS